MAQPTASQIVQAALDCREKKMSDPAAVKRLQELGIPSADAPALIECVVQGFKAGNVAVITGGMSSVDLPLGQLY